MRLQKGDVVTLVHAQSSPPLVVSGSVVRVDGPLLELRVEPHAGTVNGVTTLIVDTPPPSQSGRMIVRIDGFGATGVSARTVREVAPDKRVFPRCHGALEVRYIAVRDGAAARSWVETGEPPMVAANLPDPYMSFSVGGLAFDDVPRVRTGDLIAISLRVPSTFPTHRALGRVTRIDPIPVDERDDAIHATHRVAVNFELLPTDAATALAAYTLRIQGALLEGTT